jgi:hypothetical protein
MELNIRKLKESDWDILVSLWKMWPEWQTHPTKALLPENGTGGLIVEKNGIAIIAGFLYTTNSKVGWIEWIVSNKNYREKDRKKAAELLVSGIEIILSVGRNKGLIETHRNLGYTIDEDPSYEISKRI